MDHLQEMYSVRNSQSHGVADYFVKQGWCTFSFVYYMPLAFNPHPSEIFKGQLNPYSLLRLVLGTQIWTAKGPTSI